MQGFLTIPNTHTLQESLAELMNNDKTALSWSAGTVFPSTELLVGMPCFRTDQLKLYLLVSTGPATWQMILDLNRVIAYLDSPAFSGTPTAPTPDGADSTTKIATTAFVQGLIAAVNSTLAAKAPLASPALTGAPTAPTPTAGDNTTKIATTAFLQAALASYSLTTHNHSGTYALAAHTHPGTNGEGARTVSTAAPSGGVDGDVWYKTA